MAGTGLFTRIKYMSYSTVTSLVIVLIIFGIMGTNYSGQELDTSQIQLISTLDSSFNILSALLEIVPVVVIVLVMLKVPLMPGLFMERWQV